MAALFKIGGDYLKDRQEDRQARRLPPELRHRQLRIRRWRQGLTPQSRKSWAARRGLVGKNMRQLIPPAYSQQLERELLAASPGGKCLQVAETTRPCPVLSRV